MSRKFVIFYWSLLKAMQVAGYKWYPSPNGPVKVIDQQMTYPKAVNFCKAEGATSLLPLSRRGDILNLLNNQLEFWVDDPSSDPKQDICTVIHYDFNVQTWLPEKRSCQMANFFVCGQPLSMTSTSPSKTTLPNTSVDVSTAFTEITASMNTPLFRSSVAASEHVPPTSGIDPPSMHTFPQSLSASVSMERSSSSLPVPPFAQMLTPTRVVASVTRHTQLLSLSASGPIPEIGYAQVLMQVPLASKLVDIHLGQRSASALVSMKTSFSSNMPDSFYSHTPLLQSLSVLSTSSAVSMTLHASSLSCVSASVNLQVPPTASPTVSAYVSMTTNVASAPTMSASLFKKKPSASESASMSTPISSPLGTAISVSEQMSLELKSASISMPTSLPLERAVSASFQSAGVTLTSVSMQTTSALDTSALVPTQTSSAPSLSASVSTQLPSASSTAASATSTGWLTIGHIEYGLSSQRCAFAKSGQCCRDDGATLSMTFDSATLHLIVRSLRQHGKVNKIWINGTSCFLSQKARCDILTVFNGTNVYDTADANESHFSLCQRPTYSRPPCREFYHQWEVVGSMEYLKLGRPRTYKKAEAECRKFNSDLLNATRMMTDRFLLDDLQLRHDNSDFWIKNNTGFFSHSTTSLHCVALNIENKQLNQKNFNCFDSLYSICERPVSVHLPISTPNVPSAVTATITASRKPDWVKHKRHEYYVTENPVSYAEAEDQCKKKLNSSLAFFAMATMYLKLAMTLHLDQENYWVGAGLEPTSGDSCLLLQVQGWNSSALYSTDCSNAYRSICRRPVKNDSLTFDPEFLKMLDDMSKTVKTTRTRLRKLTSAKDNRKSAKAVGLVGLSFILLVSLVIIGFDVTNLKGCPKRRRRTMSSSIA